MIVMTQLILVLMVLVLKCHNCGYSGIQGNILIMQKCKLLMKYAFCPGSKVCLQLFFLDGFAEIKGQTANFHPKGDK